MDMRVAPWRASSGETRWSSDSEIPASDCGGEVTDPYLEKRPNEAKTATPESPGSRHKLLAYPSLNPPPARSTQGPPEPVGGLLVPERFDRVHHRRAAGRVKPEQDADAHRDAEGQQHRRLA